MVASGAIAGLVSRSFFSYSSPIEGTDNYCRFFTAPLDVLKIRLQLQVHSSADPLKDNDPLRQVRYGTVKTFKTILKDEGVTVGITQRLFLCRVYSD